MKFLLAILAVLVLCGSAEANNRRQQRENVRDFRQAQRQANHHHNDNVQAVIFVDDHHRQNVRVVQIRQQQHYAQPIVAVPVIAGDSCQSYSGVQQLNGGSCSAFLRH